MIGAGSGEAENGPDEDFTDGFFITTHGKVGKWWKKCLSMNERLSFFRIVSSNMPIGSWVGGTRG